MVTSINLTATWEKVLVCQVEELIAVQRILTEGKDKPIIGGQEPT